MQDIQNNSSAWLIIFLCWIVASIATTGSLFFSEVMGFPPCILCWYQRICMYPLVLLLLGATIKPDKHIFKYSFPIAFFGWIIALYHNLLHYEIVPESASPCREGLSCSDVWINWLGFITIPILSFTAFSIILCLLVIFYKRFINEK